MKTINTNKALHKLAAFSLISSSVLFMHSANAEPTGYNQISFSVEADQEVENDEVTATLYKKVQANTPNRLATELNRAMNNALNEAKRFPTVNATTGSQHTYPQYDEDGKIIGWTGTASINLESNDFAKSSELIAKLQENLVIQNISFGVSEQKQKSIEKQLINEASLAFKEQAKSLAEVWDMSGYKIVSVSINNNNRHNYYPSPVMKLEAASDASAPPQNFEGGNTRLGVSANGTIELIPWMN